MKSLHMHCILILNSHDDGKKMQIKWTRPINSVPGNSLEILDNSSLLIHFSLNQAEPEFGVHGGIVNIRGEGVHHLTGPPHGDHGLKERKRNQLERPLLNQLLNYRITPPPPPKRNIPKTACIHVHSTINTWWSFTKKILEQSVLRFFFLGIDRRGLCLFNWET